MLLLAVGRIRIFETMNFLDQHIDLIKSLCEQHKVGTLYAFGSVLTDKFTDDSDVDLIVDFKGVDLLDYADNYFDLKFSLEDKLQRPVDLIEQKALKNPYFIKAVEQNRKLIYG